MTRTLRRCPCWMLSSAYVAYLLLLTFVALTLGCRQPWYAANEGAAESLAAGGGTVSGQSEFAQRPLVAMPHGPSAASPTEDPFEPESEQSWRGTAVAELVAELEEAEEIDPAAREELLADLRAADPAHWPLIVHQVRATLAYRRQQGEAGQADQNGGRLAADAAETPHRSRPSSRQTSSETTHQAAEGNAGSTNAAGGSADLALAFAEDESASHGEQPDAPETDQVGASATPPPYPEPEAEPAEFSFGVGTEASFAEAIPVPPVAPREVATAAFEEPLDEPPATSTHGKVPEPSPTVEASGVLADHSWQQVLNLAISELEEATAAPPATSAEIAEHARLRLLHVAAGNQSEAVRPIEGVPPHQQDFWARLLFGLSTYMDEQTQQDPRRRASLAQRHLDEALDLLGESAILVVRNLTFCESVRGFGIYEPLQRPRFHAGEQVKLYAEVDNYRSEQTEEGYRTILATSYEILDESDRRVDSGEFPQVEDLCRSRRRDFHIQYGVKLPTRIYPGTYRLQLTIEDALSRKLGRASVAFEIVDGDSGSL